MSAVSEGKFMGRVDFIRIMNYYHINWFIKWFMTWFIWRQNEVNYDPRC